MKEESLLLKTKEIYSFDSHGETYDLEKINFESSRKLINLLERLKKLERINKLRIVMRGFSITGVDNKYSQTLHDYFKAEELNRFFVVGQKAANYLRREEEIHHALYNRNFESKELLIEEIKSLFEEAKKILQLKIEIKGELNQKLIDIDMETSHNQLIYNRLFLTAFLHNIGNKWSDKVSTPFISVTHGKNKKITAKKFATNNRNGEAKNSGYILLGYMPIENLKFEKLTADLNDELNRLGIAWYKDIHNEILFLDGIMPHRIIGLFEICADGEEQFILNPWLQNMFRRNNQFNYKQGIDINQRDFEEFAQQLGYRGYILEEENNRYNKTFETESYKPISGFEKL